MSEEYEHYVRKRLLFCVSGSADNTRQFRGAFGFLSLRLVTYRGKRRPPAIIREYYEARLGCIGEEATEDQVKHYRIEINETCLEIIRDYQWTPELLSPHKRFSKSELEALIGYIHVIDLNDKNSIDDIIETMKLVSDYPYVVAVQKSDAEHDWYNDYPILTSPETLTYDVDDIESVAEVYRALVRKMPISDEDKQGFLDCIAWQIENHDKT